MGHLASGTEAVAREDDRSDGQGLSTGRASGPTGPSPPSSATSTRPSSVPLLERTFGRMARPAGPAAATALPALPRPKGRRLLLVDKPDATQAYFTLGGPGYAMGDRITAAASAMNTLFGGPFHLLAQYRAPHQAGPDLRRLELGPRLGRGRPLLRQLLHQERQDRRDARYRLRPAREGRPGRLRRRRDRERPQLHPGTVPAVPRDQRQQGRGLRPAGLLQARLRRIRQVPGRDRQARPRRRSKRRPRSSSPRTTSSSSSSAKAEEIRPLLAKFGAWQEKKITDPGF